MHIEELKPILEIAAQQGASVHIHLHLGDTCFGTKKDVPFHAPTVAPSAAKPATGIDREVLKVLAAGPQKKEAIIRMTAQGKGPSHGRAVSRSLERLAAAGLVANISHGWWKLTP